MNPKYIWLLVAVLVLGVAASGPIIQRATQTQVNTGTDNTRFVTPLTLANKPGLGGGSTNNVTLTGANTIRTNLIVDATTTNSIGSSNVLEVVTAANVKALQANKNGSIYAGSNVVARGFVEARGGNTPSDGGFWMPNASGVSTVRMHTDASGSTILRPGTSGFYVEINNFANSAELMTIRDDGNVRIGTGTSASAKLDVGGDIKASTTITATNGLISYSNLFVSRVPSATIGGTNIFEVVNQDTNKVFMVGTNGYTYAGSNVVVYGNKTSTSNNAALWLQGDAAGVSGTNYQLRMSGYTDPLKSLLIGVDTTANAAQLQATRIGFSDYPIGLNPAGGAVGVNTVSPQTWGRFAVRGGETLNSRKVSGSFSDALTGTFDIRHSTGTIDLSSQDAALTLSTTTSGTAGIERLRISTAGEVSIGGTITATNGLAVSTNYVAANMTPVQGLIKLVGSNNVLFIVTTTSTNTIPP